MKRLFPFLMALLLVSVLVLPALGAELAGGYYFVADSALGSGLTFYVPSGYAAESFTYDESGYLFNLTSSTIYLYCPDYPDYTISASRFSGFTYRAGSGYTSTDLNLTNVTDTNIQILVSDPVPAIADSTVLLLILVVLIVGVGAYVILRRC